MSNYNRITFKMCVVISIAVENVDCALIFIVPRFVIE